jgi:hypothetical protein
MQAAERGLSFDSRGARTDPALPEPLARFRGPLLVSAASGTQIESAPMATKQKAAVLAAGCCSSMSRVARGNLTPGLPQIPA